MVNLIHRSNVKVVVRCLVTVIHVGVFFPAINLIFKFFVDHFEEQLSLGTLPLLISVEQPRNNFGILELNIIELVSRASLLLDFFHILLDLLYLLEESLLVWILDMVSLLKCHRLLVEIHAKGNTEHRDQSLHQIQEQLAVAKQSVVSRVAILNRVLLFKSLEVLAKHCVNSGRVVLEFLVKWRQKDMHPHCPREK